MLSPARQVAFDVLRKVHAGGYASDLLLKYSDKLDSRDAGLASEIVFGCLRYQAQLDPLDFPPCSSVAQWKSIRLLNEGRFESYLGSHIPGVCPTTAHRVESDLLSSSDLLRSGEMKLPGGELAVVEIAKLRDYCLNPSHPPGRHKARVFTAALNLGQADAEFLRPLLRELGAMLTRSNLLSHEIKAGCGRCGACSSLSAYEGGVARKEAR